MFATRECNNPAPVNGGQYCIGQRIKYEHCNTQDCPPGTPDFREQQCQQLNNNNFGITGIAEDVKWIPKYGGLYICQVYAYVFSGLIFKQNLN